MNEEEVLLDGYLMGPGHPVFVTELLPGTAEPREHDSENPTGDQRFFGRDYYTPPVWTLTMSAETRSDLNEIAKLWRTPKRRIPGAEQELYYHADGVTRMVYGRTRRYTPNPALLTAIGEFVTSSTLHFGSELQEVVVTLVPPPTGGITMPLTFPMVMAQTSEVQGTIDDVGGDTETPFEIEFQGPVTNPGARGNGWELALTGTLAYDQKVIVNTRLGTAVDNFGNSWGGALRRSIRLQDIRLSPGADHVIFNGTDPTGTARAIVRWRPAYEGF